MDPKPLTTPLDNLLAEGEHPTYQGKLHPLNGWPYLLATTGAWSSCYFFPSLGHFLWPALAILALGGLSLLCYIVPFFTNTIVVTTHRLLIKHGLAVLALDSILPDHIDHVQFHQNPVQNLLNTGVLVLQLKSGPRIMALKLPYIQSPIGFLEALTPLNLKQK